MARVVVLVPGPGGARRLERLRAGADRARGREAAGRRGARGAALCARPQGRRGGVPAAEPAEEAGGAVGGRRRPQLRLVLWQRRRGGRGPAVHQGGAAQPDRAACRR
eukprot:scaffold496_cov380-Prasinococcus_capsulatus_cf.AAC.1